ncbi:MAG: hypothetical protein IJ480_00730 [Clostridia bacterium]|nr:hypothetical protein [Clostridia bacterium]
MKKIITVLLLAAMLTSLASCGSEVVETDTADTAADTAAVEETQPAEETDALEARKNIADELPEKTFGGAVFTVLSDEPNYLMDNAIDIEESTGEVVDDAVFARNALVEERFGVTVEARYLPVAEVIKTLNTEVLAGDDVNDLVASHVCNMGQALFNDMYVNWYDVPYVNFAKPWWSPSTVNELTYDGKCFIAVGDVALSSLQATYCYYFNKQLVEDYQIPDVYETVLEGKWTVDYLISLTKDIYTDTNNSGDRDEEDFYGLCTNASSNANTYLWAFDSRIIDKNAEGGLEVVYNSEKTVDIVTKLVSMYNENVGISYNLNYVDSEGNKQFPYPRDMFLNNRTVFASGQINMSLTHFRDMESDYGIIPYPKWNEEQAEYRTMVDGSHSAMAIPVTVQDMEMAGIITEAMCAESYKQVIPAYYDTALKYKGTRDETSVEILDMIVNARVFDMGYVYDGWKGASFLIQEMVRSASSNFASTWAGKEQSVTAHYAEVIEYFEAYGE